MNNSWFLSTSLRASCNLGHPYQLHKYTCTSFPVTRVKLKIADQHRTGIAMQVQIAWAPGSRSLGPRVPDDLGPGFQIAWAPGSRWLGPRVPDGLGHGFQMAWAPGSRWLGSRVPAPWYRLSNDEYYKMYLLLRSLICHSLIRRNIDCPRTCINVREAIETIQTHIHNYRFIQYACVCLVCWVV